LTFDLQPLTSDPVTQLLVTVTSDPQLVTFDPAIQYLAILTCPTTFVERLVSRLPVTVT